MDELVIGERAVMEEEDEKTSYSRVYTSLNREMMDKHELATEASSCNRR